MNKAKELKELTNSSIENNKEKEYELIIKKLEESALNGKYYESVNDISKICIEKLQENGFKINKKEEIYGRYYVIVYWG